MPEDRLTITADGSQAFRVLDELSRSGDRLGRSGERIGAGFLKGERATETAMRGLTSGLLVANDAATAVSITLEGLTRALRLPLFVGATAVGGVVLFQKIQEQIKRTEAATESLRDELKLPLAFLVEGSPEALSREVEELTVKMEALRKETQSTTKAILNLAGRSIGTAFSAAGAIALARMPGLAGLSRGGGSIPRDPEATQVLAASEERRAKAAAARADSELRIAAAKSKQLDDSKELGDIEEAEVKFADRRNDLLDEFLKKGGNVLDVFKRFSAAQFTLDTAINSAFQRTIDRLEAGTKKWQDALRKFSDTTSDFFRDVGSGKFARDFQQQQLEEQQKQRGREIIAEIQDAAARGVALDPILQAELREAQRLAEAGGGTIGDLLKADFSNLLELSKYDFSGLQPLSGLTIQIQ